RTDIRGWTSLVCLQVIFSGATLMAIGLIGDYLARLYEEAKGRPLYVIASIENLSGPVMAVPRAFVLPSYVSREPEPANRIDEPVRPEPQPLASTRTASRCGTEYGNRNLSF